MKVRFLCGCGMYNHNFQDWIAHFKYGKKGKLHALKLLFSTKMEISK